jgi:hypothetical protein
MNRFSCPVTFLAINLPAGFLPTGTSWSPETAPPINPVILHGSERCVGVSTPPQTTLARHHRNIRADGGHRRACRLIKSEPAVGSDTSRMREHEGPRSSTSHRRTFGIVGLKGAKQKSRGFEARAAGRQEHPACISTSAACSSATTDRPHRALTPIHPFA